MGEGRGTRTRVVLALAVVMGCSAQRSESPAHPTVQRNFDLVCDSADTNESSTMFCMRMDTRNGDILFVDQTKLTQSNGPTAAAMTEPPESYQLVCDSTNTPTKADFRCLRLHRGTGEIVLVGLPKVGKFPQ
jgi:hypothetical protein